MMKQLIFLLFAFFGASLCFAETKNGWLDDRISWTLADSVLTIQGRGAMPSYNTTNMSQLPWQDEEMAEGIAKIVISEGITEIGSYCFGSRTYIRDVRNESEHTYYATQGATTTELFCNIKDVILPKTLKKIGHHAFARMPLSHIAFQEGLEEISSGAFTNTALQCVILPTTMVKIGAEAFCGCKNLRAIDFNYLALKIPAGLLFDAENLRLVMHPSNIKSVADNSFESTPLDGIPGEHLLEVFRTDGVGYYLDSFMPLRRDFQGSDEEYEAERNKVLDKFYAQEAKNATSMFELDRLTLMPYDEKSGTCRIETVHHGTLLLPLTPEQARILKARWPKIRKLAQPVYLPVNGQVELQSVNFPVANELLVAALIKND